jgi:hypothetical protein
VSTEHAVPILPCRDLAVSLAFYERLGFQNRGAPPEEWGYCLLIKPPVDSDYGQREFAVIDPSGNLVRVGSPL